MDKIELKALAALYGAGEPPTAAEVEAVQQEKKAAHTAHESEYQHQARLHYWLKKQQLLHFAPANEGKRSEFETRRLTAVGFTCGVLDMWIMEPRKPYHGLILELKTVQGVISGAQSYWLRELNRRAYKSIVSYSFEESKKLVIDYLSLPEWDQENQAKTF